MNKQKIVTRVISGFALTLAVNSAYSGTVTAPDAGQILNVDRHDIEGAQRLLSVAELGETVRSTLTARVAAGGQHGEDVDRLYLD